MILNLDFNSDKPIYIQMKEEIIKAIAKGDLKVNESLPSVRAMAEEIVINLHTVNKAYNLLNDEGYINIDRRKGAMVNNLPLQIDENSQEEIVDEIELLVAKSYLKGISKEEFMKACEKYFDEYEVKKYE